MIRGSTVVSPTPTIARGRSVTVGSPCSRKLRCTSRSDSSLARAYACGCCAAGGSAAHSGTPPRPPPARRPRRRHPRVKVGGKVERRRRDVDEAADAGGHAGRQQVLRGDDDRAAVRFARAERPRLAECARWTTACWPAHSALSAWRSPAPRSAATKRLAPRRPSAARAARLVAFPRSPAARVAARRRSRGSRWRR